MGLHDRLHRQNGTGNGHSADALDLLAGQQPEQPLDAGRIRMPS